MEMLHINVMNYTCVSSVLDRELSLSIQTFMRSIFDNIIMGNLIEQLYCLWFCFLMFLYAVECVIWGPCTFG